MVRIINKRRGTCLTAYEGLTSGLEWWTTRGARDARFNVQAAAPVGLQSCAQSETMRDDRHVWRCPTLSVGMM